MLKLSAKREQQILEILNTLMFASIIALASGLGTELMKVLPPTYLTRAFCMAPVLIATFLFTTYLRYRSVMKLFDIEERRIDGMMDLIGRMIDQSEKMADEMADLHEKHSILVNEVQQNHAKLAAAIDELRWAVRNEENQ